MSEASPPPSESADIEREGRQRLVLVTGPAGAGRSTAIHALEDLGYESIDNLPLSLVPRLIEGPARPVPLALGIDTRNRDFSIINMIETLNALSDHPLYACELLYLDCAPDILVRRFSETRRRHPLAAGNAPLAGILTEREVLAPLQARADVLIDTTEMTPHDLKADIGRWFDSQPGQRMTVSIHSFSYKRGVPRGLDMMFDARFLNNPYWNTTLREEDGRNPAVQRYVQADGRYDGFFNRVLDLVQFVLPAHVAEGRSHLAIGFGCSGGKHRSVTLTEKLGEALAQAGWRVSIRHRELEHRGAAPSAGGASAP